MTGDKICPLCDRPMGQHPFSDCLVEGPRAAPEHPTGQPERERDYRGPARRPARSRGPQHGDGSVSVESELRQVLVELELCSHVSAVNLDPSSRDAGEDIGGKRPPGGIDRREDRQPREADQRILRSADHFRRQLLRGRPAHYVLEEARAALAAHRRPPKPKDKEHPMPGDFNWKRWVVESSLSAGEIGHKCGVSAQYVRRIRARYRGAFAWLAATRKDDAA
jgi:hypothetical protein